MKNLPVSKKFYNDIISRITSTFADMNDGERCLRGAVAMIDGYLSGDNPECADPMIKMVFSLLRPEIDRAMARSLRARQRGRKRKSSSLSPTASAAAASAPANSPSTISTLSSIPLTDNSLSFFPLNRRERRLERQAEKREARRAMRLKARKKAAAEAPTTARPHELTDVKTRGYV